jgi:hypothetical protein
VRSKGKITSYFWSYIEKMDNKKNFFTENIFVNLLTRKRENILTENIYSTRKYRK